MNIASISLALLPVVCAVQAAESYHAIKVVDEVTNRGVPLVELRTTNDIVYYTDSNGYVAFSEPGLMDREVFFTVTSHGYEFPQDTFGFRGKIIQTTPGAETVLTIKRINIAERLYRVTGAGIYLDSKRLGKESPIEEPLLNAQVVGSDSVQTQIYRGRIYWFWGDTNRPKYPLGNFDVTGATSRLPSDGGLDPATGVNLDYFVGEDGFARPACKMPGDGPTWIDGLITIKDSGRERLFATYIKVKPPLTIYRHGLAEFNPEKDTFEPSCEFPEGAPSYPAGHAFLHTEGGVEYVYFTRPLPLVRVPAKAESLKDLSQYETFTCFAPGSRDESKLDRSPDGKLRYGWKRDTAPLTQEIHDKLVRSRKIRPEESVWNVRDIESGKRIQVHHGSIYWNDYRQRWIMVTSEIRGTSTLGEVWYAESSAPEGPWTYARKIITHERQSFYNPKQQPMFAQESGRIIYVEGTYTNSFSESKEGTPRYNYNQMMYRLDLADPRLVLPLPVYRNSADGREGFSFSNPDPANPTFSQVAFLACDRNFPDAVAIYAEQQDRANRLSASGGTEKTPLFFGLPADKKDVPNTAELYEYTSSDGRRSYRTGEEEVEGFRRGNEPICRVWVVPHRTSTLNPK